MRYKTMRGKTIDVSRVFAENEYQVAIGNAGMNARGDLVDKNGRVLKTREEIAESYHSHLPKRPATAPNRDLDSQVVKTPAQIMAELDAQRPPRKMDTSNFKTIEDAVQEMDERKPRRRKIIDSDD